MAGTAQDQRRTREVDAGFARRLRQALQARGVRKLYPLALELGVDESAICRWRQGRAISTGNVVRLCEHLDLSIDWLLTGRGAMTPVPAPGSPGDWQARMRAAIAALGADASPADILGLLATACRDER